ncbi:MAG: hypothetical protein ACOY90_21125 [Candidatus Zhuqueibacterota bacterium]
MFREFVKQNGASLPNGARTLFQAHPFELLKLLELTWRNKTVTGTIIGTPVNRSKIASSSMLNRNLNAFGRGLTVPAMWDHLIYAYMIENTRIYEIFNRVLIEFLHGEKLGTLSPESQQWMHNTEELFYKDPLPLTITSIVSHIRPDMRATRRNAYQRMFGMDLNHGKDDGQPYPYIRADAANNEFVITFEELLREVWIGMTHISASAAPKPIDDAKIITLLNRLSDMLLSRRKDGSLSREEFALVSMMSWFHLTIETDPEPSIIEDLRAQATGAEQRLYKIAQRVGLPAHGLSSSLFDIADPISRILIQIEMKTYNNSAKVIELYTKGTAYPASFSGPGPEADLRMIITHWSIITGHDVKAGKVAVR